MTSVPSDAPDDFAALRDLKKKEVFKGDNFVSKLLTLPSIKIYNALFNNLFS